MSVKKRFCACCFSMLFFAFQITAQDVHFSQHFHTPLYINPSFNGLSPGMGRFSLNAKNQWLSVKSPYQTFLAGFDNSWKVNKAAPGFFSTGVIMYYDVAGDANFSNTRLTPSFSYTFLLNNTFNTLVSLGAQAGIVQRTLDVSKLRFDSQFNGYFYDPNLPTNEIVDNQTFIFADVGVGAHYINFFSQNTYAGGGFAVQHLNRPVVSMKNSDEIRLDIKYLLHGEGRFYWKSYTVLPSLYFAKQGPHTELLFGARMIINQVSSPVIDQNLLFRKNFILGLYYRGLDAIILYAGAEVQNYHFGVSYDVNLSRLTPASYARGGVEISASYIWQKSRRHRNKDIPCPIF